MTFLNFLNCINDKSRFFFPLKRLRPLKHEFFKLSYLLLMTILYSSIVSLFWHFFMSKGLDEGVLIGYFRNMLKVTPLLYLINYFFAYMTWNLRTKKLREKDPSFSDKLTKLQLFSFFLGGCVAMLLILSISIVYYPVESEKEVRENSFFENWSD